MRFDDIRTRCTLRSVKILATKSPLKMMKNIFYFMLKALPILKIFRFFFNFHVGHVEKRLYLKDKVNFKIYDARTCLINNCNENSSVHRI